MADVMVLGGYGAVGQHAVRTLAHAGMGVVVAGRRREPAERLAARLGDAEAVVVDAAAPETVAAVAERVDAVVDCSGRESVELVAAGLAGAAHLVGVVGQLPLPAGSRPVRGRRRHGSPEVLFSVGLTVRMP